MARSIDESGLAPGIPHTAEQIRICEEFAQLTGWKPHSVEFFGQGLVRERSVRPPPRCAVRVRQWAAAGHFPERETKVMVDRAAYYRAALHAGRAICLHVWRHRPGASERGCELCMRRFSAVLIVASLLLCGAYVGTFCVWWLRSPCWTQMMDGKPVRVVEFRWNKVYVDTHPLWAPARWFVQHILGYKPKGFVAMFEDSKQ